MTMTVTIANPLPAQERPNQAASAAAALPIPSPDQLDGLQRELDALRDEVSAALGETDVNYMKNIIRVQRYLEISGRTLIHFSFTPIPFALGVTALTLAKIIDNMEIGHNVMHGQFDWTNDPRLHSRNFEWDTACDSQSWKRTHNYEHHTFTNIIGKDRDYGYAVMRLSDDTPWRPHHRFQLLNFTLLSVFFQWGVALHELEAERLGDGSFDLQQKKPYLKALLRKGSKQIFKDYVFFPLLADGQPGTQPVGIRHYFLRPPDRTGADLCRRRMRERKSRPLVLPSAAGLQQSGRRPPAAYPERSPQLSDRAPPVPRYSRQPL